MNIPVIASMRTALRSVLHWNPLALGPRRGAPAAAALLALTERVPAMAAPCRMHPAVYAIEAAVMDWARRTGLRADPGTGFHRMAGRAFAEFDAAAAALFAQWLTWLFNLDDELDENRGDVDLFHGLLEGGAAHPLESAFADLWRVTSVRMSDLWRTRFAANLMRQHDACRVEAENRATGRVPTLEQYPALRRGTVGPYLYDLVEPCLRVEVPAWVHECEPWQELVNACNDVTAWCNDVASLPKERGDTHNLVVVVMHQLGLDQPEATAWVLDRIAERCQDMHDAVLRLPLDTLTPRLARDVSKVACAYMAAPRAHLDWLMESTRYT
ncbi:terpene synthase family protein [Nonomuraea rhizosphaerae]|uniref:terpene synthase family protein n=1 Tax=Nonomuraea rhizosphaerae TaxID=2665663 RepID=UPI0027E39FF9|nr:terpene synthase family protein [Nonomuraea rhizosphaerae]